jgi:hypothetical protein
MSLQPFVGLWPLLQFRNLFYTDDKTNWTSDQPVARQLPTHRTTQTENKRTQTSMPGVGFEPTIPASEQAKTVHASDRAAAVIGLICHTSINFTPGISYIRASGFLVLNSYIPSWYQ